MELNETSQTRRLTPSAVVTAMNAISSQRREFRDLEASSAKTLLDDDCEGNRANHEYWVQRITELNEAFRELCEFSNM